MILVQSIKSTMKTFFSEVNPHCPIFYFVIPPPPFGHQMAYRVPGPGIEPVSWCYRDAANPVAPQWELLFCEL